MLSGALLLDPSKDEPSRVFLKKRTRRVILPLLFWSFAYYCWSYFFHDMSLNLNSILLSFIKGQPYFHLYFLFLISGLYLITPMLRIYVRNALPTERKYFVFISLILAVFYSLFLHFICNEKLIISLNSITLFIPFIGFYVAGYHLSRVKMEGNLFNLIILSIISILLSTIGIFILEKQFLTEARGVYLSNYLSPAIVITATLFFMLLRNFGDLILSSKSLHFHNFCKRASQAVLGVYLIHPMIIEILERFVGVSPFYPTPWMGILIVTFLTTVICFFIIMAAQRIPFFRYIIG